MAKHRAVRARRPGSHRGSHRKTQVAAVRPAAPTLALAGSAVILIAGVGAAYSAPASPTVRDTVDYVALAGGIRPRGADAEPDASAAGAAPPTSAGVGVGARPPVVSRSAADRGSSGSRRTTQRLERRRAEVLSRINVQVARRATFLQDNAWVLPLASYRLTALFGASSGLWSRNHTGVDFAADTGTPIKAVGSGLVTAAGYAGPYGYKVVLLHPDGTETWYAHMNSIEVEAGEQVLTGELVGTVGSTGNVTGPHLHLEVRPPGSGPVDPLTALRQRGLTP